MIRMPRFRIRPLAFRIVETRDARFPGVRGIERRTVAGLLHLLGREGVADYADIRPIDLGPEAGTITLRYYVLNEEATDPARLHDLRQGLTITQQRPAADHEGSSCGSSATSTSPFLNKRLVVVVDGTGLANATKRDGVLLHPREPGQHHHDECLDRVTSELREDENLLPPAQRSRASASSKTPTKSTSET